MFSRMTGVTLIELVIVMVLTAILATMMTSFILPVFHYADTKRRAEMTDMADTALRRMARDLHNALPNSVRVTPDGQSVEMLLLRAGGRYRADIGSAGGTACPADGSGDPSILVFGASSPDTCFKSLGGVLNVANIVPNSDFVVVYNLQPGTTNADAYAFPGTGGNKSLITAVASEANQVRFAIASNAFRFESPAQRFQVIEGPVSYVCDPTTKTLTRYSGYPIASAQLAPPVGGSSALVVSNVTCQFTYDAFALALSEGLVTLSLSISSQDLKGSPETVSLYETVHVSNIP